MKAWEDRNSGIFFLLLWGIFIANALMDITQHRPLSLVFWLWLLGAPIFSTYLFVRAARWRREARRLSDELLARGFDAAELDPPSSPRPPSLAQWRTAAIACVVFGVVSLVASGYFALAILSALRAQRPVEAESWLEAVLLISCTLVLLWAAVGYTQFGRHQSGE